MARQGITRQKIVNREARRTRNEMSLLKRATALNRWRCAVRGAKRALVKNTGSGANGFIKKIRAAARKQRQQRKTASPPGRLPKNLTRICAARKTGARGIKRREAELKTP